MLILFLESHLIPGYIYNGGVYQVNENENVMFKCKADETEKPVYMYLFKNGEILKMTVIDPTQGDTILNLKVTVEDSGLYTCLYSEVKLSDIKSNASGHNTVLLKVLGRRHS